MTNSHGSKALSSWYNFLELILAGMCFVLVTYNLIVLFRQKVYTSWSTTAVLLSCSLLLLARAVCLFLYAIMFDDTNTEQWFFFSSFVTDLPNYLACNITLSIIWQWYRIGGLLSQTATTSAEIKTGRSSKHLIYVQLALAAAFLLDLSFLISHFGFGWLQGENLGSDVYTQNSTWLELRSLYKLVNLFIMTFLLIMACLVFNRVYVTIKSEESLQSLRKQVNIFLLIFLGQLVMRYVGYLVWQGQWIYRNLVKHETDLNSLDNQQELFCIICTICELFLDYFLMVYLFVGQPEHQPGERQLSQVVPPSPQFAGSTQRARAKDSHGAFGSSGNSKIAPSDLAMIPEDPGSLDYPNGESGSVPGFSSSVGQYDYLKLPGPKEYSNNMNRSSDGNRTSRKARPELQAHSNRNSAETVNASEEDKEENSALLHIDRSNHVVMMQPLEEQVSDEMSIDLNALARLPQARLKMKDPDADTVVDVFTTHGSFVTSNTRGDRRGLAERRPSYLDHEQSSTLKTDSQLERSASLREVRAMTFEEQAHIRNAHQSTKLGDKEPVKFFFGPVQLMRQVTKMHQQQSLIQSRTSSRQRSASQLTRKFSITNSALIPQDQLSQSSMNDQVLKKRVSYNATLMSSNLAKTQSEAVVQPISATHLKKKSTETVQNPSLLLSAVKEDPHLEQVDKSNRNTTESLD